MRSKADDEFGRARLERPRRKGELPSTQAKGNRSVADRVRLDERGAALDVVAVRVTSDLHADWPIDAGGAMFTELDLLADPDEPRPLRQLLRCAKKLEAA
uniref:hypothetical protein n=1 Tax=Ensifer adhaerens TaxID=106592 RepID=UPI003F498C2C